jgi:pyruvate dehydrogenase E2 component (dihydrolipoamide acetyltransferase)
MEYEAYQAGTLAEILVPEGENADIGTPIALLDDGARGPAPSVPAASAKTVSAEREQLPPFGSNDSKTPAPASRGSVSTPTNGHVNGGVNGSGVNGAGRQIASPLVRKLVRENHLDLSQVAGSGPGGRIIRADMAGLLASGIAAPVPSAAASAKRSRTSTSRRPRTRRP